jgi:Fe(3+) dicitrate transport protein
MYRLTAAVTFKSRILNILDESYAVSRAPAGLRPGHPFGVYAGFEVKF